MGHEANGIERKLDALEKSLDKCKREWQNVLGVMCGMLYAGLGVLGIYISLHMLGMIIGAEKYTLFTLVERVCILALGFFVTLASFNAFHLESRFGRA